MTMRTTGLNNKPSREAALSKVLSDQAHMNSRGYNEFQRAVRSLAATEVGFMVINLKPSTDAALMVLMGVPRIPKAVEEHFGVRVHYRNGGKERLILGKNDDDLRRGLTHAESVEKKRVKRPCRA